MHSGFEIPGIQQQQQDAPVYLSTNPTHILDQIHSLPATQQLFLDQHHFLQPHHHHQSRISHHYGGGGYFPVNFKLGLNEICSRNDYKAGPVSSINGGEDASLLRGSEHYQVPQPRQASLGMLHCWQNPQDSHNKQTPFWEPLPSEVSNENSEIVDRQEHLEMNQKGSTLRHCLDGKSRVHFGELEAIYKRLDTADSIQTCPNDHVPPVNAQLPLGSEASIDEGDEEDEGGPVKDSGRKRRRKKKKKKSGYGRLITPMAEFFGDLVKKMMDHQENLQSKFTEVMERLEEERMGREEAWRSQELAHFEREAEARAHDKALAMSREAMIISYLEKITGERISFDHVEISPATNKISDEFGGEGQRDEAR